MLTSIVDMYSAISPSSGRTWSRSSGLSVKHTWLRIFSRIALSSWLACDAGSNVSQCQITQAVTVGTSVAFSDMEDRVLIRKRHSSNVTQKLLPYGKNKLMKSARWAMSFKPSTPSRSRDSTARDQETPHRTPRTPTARPEGELRPSGAAVPEPDKKDTRAFCAALALPADSASSSILAPSRAAYHEEELIPRRSAQTDHTQSPPHAHLRHPLRRLALPPSLTTSQASGTSEAQTPGSGGQALGQERKARTTDHRRLHNSKQSLLQTPLRHRQSHSSKTVAWSELFLGGRSRC
ncbi:hypothetical protein GQ600_23008 [Phytophthora cactorum]|nr:hypothetical protein GQ600_23008 [Phytophthora cactorum]